MLSNQIVEWIQHLSKTNGMKKAILGISGGKDSTVAAMLLVKALGKENVIGVLMPNGTQSDIEDSHFVCDTLGIQKFIVNMNSAYEALLYEIEQNNMAVNDMARVNILPRLRINTLYTIGQSLGARVCGTGNLSELTVGYFTKWGDNAVDFSPLANLTSVEVVEVGLELVNEFGIPKELIKKTPSDGLWGVSDEDKLGVSYQHIHSYLRGLELPNEAREKIETYKNNTEHKRTPVPTFYHKTK